jgi:site-specific DNA recombinase
MPKAAAVYARISDDRTGEQAGVTRQEQDCKALAERRGWPVAELYVDNDLSAWNGHSRPQYQRLLSDIGAGTVDAVVVWHLDRLHRHPKELEEFFEACDRAGVRDLASVSGDVDLGTDDGRFHARILGAVARKESDDKSRRIRRKHEELARQGQGKGGGTRPFGFEDDRLTVNPAEAKLIREAADRILLGASLRSIARDWNERGIKTPAGNEWRSASLRRFLMSGRIAGLREHHGEIVAEAVWQGIIDRATHERIKMLFDNRRTRRPSARSYLLTGFAFCGLCGTRLVARPKADGRRCYVCTSGTDFGGCGKIRQLAEPVEELVAAAIFAAFDSPQFREALRDPAGDDESELVSSIQEDEKALEQLALDHYVDHIIDRAPFLAAKEALEARVEASRRTLARRDRVPTLESVSGAETLRKAWNERDLFWRRALVGTVIEKVVLNAAVRGRNFFDPARVELVWKV